MKGSLILLALALTLSACSKKEQKGIDSSRVAAGPNGRLYLDGKPWTGPHVEYFGDGQVKVEGEFLDGILLFGIFLLCVIICLNPFSSKAHCVNLSVGNFSPDTVRLETT